VIANSLSPELKPILMLMANLDPDVPYGEDLEDKADLSNPLTKMFRDDFQGSMWDGRSVAGRLL